MTSSATNYNDVITSTAFREGASFIYKCQRGFWYRADDVTLRHQHHFEVKCKQGVWMPQPQSFACTSQLMTSLYL